MTSLYDLADVAELRQLQSAARHKVQNDTDPQQALTSPRLFRHFLGCRLEELCLSSNCGSHEMLLVSSQSFREQHVSFVSTVCARCRYHFHVKSDFQQSRQNVGDHLHHMLLPCRTSTYNTGSEKDSYNDTVGHIRYICGVDECFFNIEIFSILPRISLEHVIKFSDPKRTARNLAVARANDPERYVDFTDAMARADSILRTYLHDALQNNSQKQLKINKRNKRFLVSIGNDFEDLLKFVGFHEGEDAETGEPCWFITCPSDQQKPTFVRTLRARMEDAQVELDILTGSHTSPAWDWLLQAFQGDFPNYEVDMVYTSSTAEQDLALLGCLGDYQPLLFSWSAITLAKLRPRDRDLYLDAGLRCIRNRNDDASTEIIIYKSQFDGGTPANIKLQEALQFFGSSTKDIQASAWFLEMYYVMARSNPTDDFKAIAQQHLEVIGNHLGEDIVSQIDLAALAKTEDTASNSSGRMSISSAAKVLNVEPNYTAEIIRGFVDQLVQDISVDRNKVVEAIMVLSELKSQQDMPEEARELRQLAEFVGATGGLPLLPSQLESNSATSMDNPPGLRNIGNTCYLNSLLQYFYSVRVVRDLVLNYDQVKLELDEDVVRQRRTGGNGTTVSLEEAIVARQFVEMLQSLFSELQTTRESAAQPSQKLANTALSSARDILEQESQSKPPPLPARPSPAAPAVSEADGNAVQKRPEDTVNITVESVNESLETASSRSSQTLVDEVEDTPMSYVQLETVDKKPAVVEEIKDDVKMDDSAVPWSLEERIAQVSRRLEHSDRSGTSQQDVGEIIGNILEHLMRAIRADGPMPEKPDLQADAITKTFFTTIVNYTVKTKRRDLTDRLASALEESPLNVEIVPERWITAYPEEADVPSEGTGNSSVMRSNVKCTLFEALDRYFSYEPFDDGNRARYSSIKTLPPIVHICIQRSTPKGKNMNPVIIPEILFLDRYVDAEKGSDAWLARKRTWAIKERLKELGGKSANNTPNAPIQSIEATVDPNTSHNKATYPDYKEYNHTDAEELANMATAALEDASNETDLRQAFAEDVNLTKKRKLPDFPESALSRKMSKAPSPTGHSITDKFSDILWETRKPFDEMHQEELLELRQKEQAAFEGLSKEKYSIHAVICHRGGTSAGHYWVWIRDFERNIWYRFNDETVTEDSRGTEAVLNDLNETGDPYYVAYVRDEMKDELVDIPPRPKPEPQNATGASEDIEMIEGVECDPVQSTEPVRP